MKLLSLWSKSTLNILIALIYLVHDSYLGESRLPEQYRQYDSHNNIIVHFHKKEKKIPAWFVVEVLYYAAYIMDSIHGIYSQSQHQHQHHNHWIVRSSNVDSNIVLKVVLLS